MNSVACDVWRILQSYKGVSYCDIAVGKINDNLNIFKIEALYDTTAAISAYITILLSDHDNSKPSSSVWRTPSECK